MIMQFKIFRITILYVGSSRSAGANVLDDDIIVNVFQVRSSHYVHFQTKKLVKYMTPFTQQLQVD